MRRSLLDSRGARWQYGLAALLALVALLAYGAAGELLHADAELPLWALAVFGIPLLLYFLLAIPLGADPGSLLDPLGALAFFLCFFLVFGLLLAPLRLAINRPQHRRRLVAVFAVVLLSYLALGGLLVSLLLHLESTPGV